MRMNSRRKGKTGELALVRKLKEHGYEVLRAKRDKRTLVIYKKLDAKEHLSYADRDHRLIRRFFEYMERSK